MTSQFDNRPGRANLTRQWIPALESYPGSAAHDVMHSALSAGCFDGLALQFKFTSCEPAATCCCGLSLKAVIVSAPSLQRTGLALYCTVTC
jgi:hypothetical protein